MIFVNNDSESVWKDKFLIWNIDDLRMHEDCGLKRALACGARQAAIHRHNSKPAFHSMIKNTDITENYAKFYPPFRRIAALVTR